jgi:glycosyltransferase involved in cell wall biosynthesis
VSARGLETNGRPLRIVQFIHALNDRTLAGIASELAVVMAEAGADVTLVAVHRAADSRPMPAAIPAVVLRQGTTRRTLWSLISLRRALRRLAPDVVFAHGNGPTRAAVLATRCWRGRPTVVGIEHNHYTSYEWDYRAARDTVNALLLPRADVLIGVSPGIVEDLEDTFPSLRGTLKAIPPPLTRLKYIGELAAAPVDHPWFADPQVPIITTVGHVHARKDHQTLVRAMARVRDVAGASAARLVIIGSTQDDEFVRVKALISELGLSDQVDFLGQQENPIRFVARSSVFALSSRNEGMPVVILEAMAVGVPVVSTDCPSGPSWILGEGDHGLLVPVGDATALGDALLLMLGDPALRERLSRWGIERAAEFSTPEIASRHLEAAAATGRFGPLSAVTNPEAEEPC